MKLAAALLLPNLLPHPGEPLAATWLSAFVAGAVKIGGPVRAWTVLGTALLPNREARGVELTAGDEAAGCKPVVCPKPPNTVFVPLPHCEAGEPPNDPAKGCEIGGLNVGCMGCDRVRFSKGLGETG